MTNGRADLPMGACRPQVADNKADYEVANRTSIRPTLPNMRMNPPRTWRSLEIDMQPDSESSAHPVDRVSPQPMAVIKRIAVSMHALAIEVAPE